MGIKIGAASDHGGRELKSRILDYLKSLAIDTYDYGVPHHDKSSVDYPDLAKKLCDEIGNGTIQRGILICGTGIGMSIAANKFSGIRASLVWNEYTARMARLHNDSNVLCLGERVLNHERALDLVKIWLDTSFEGGRHQQRLDKITRIETQIS